MSTIDAVVNRLLQDELTRRNYQKIDNLRATCRSAKTMIWSTQLTPHASTKRIQNVRLSYGD